MEAHVAALQKLSERASALEVLSIDAGACDVIMRDSSLSLSAEEREALQCWLAAELSLSTVAAHGQRSVVGLKAEASSFRFRVVTPTRLPLLLALSGNMRRTIDAELETHHQLLLETRDIAERYTAEADTSERSLAQVLDTLDEGYFEVDYNGSISMSGRFIELTKIEASHVDELREVWLRRSPKDSLDDNKRLFERMKTARNELMVLNLIVDDHHRTFECVINSEAGKLTGTITDASERYRALRRDSVRQETLNALVETAPFAIAVHRDNQTLYTNQRFADEIASSVDDLTDRTVAYSRGSSLLTEHETTVLDATGTQRTYDLSTSMIDWLGQGAFITVLRDVTEERAFLARSFELDRIVALGTLADGVAHEINNPLAYVQSNLEFAIRELSALHEEFDERYEVLEALKEAVEGSGRVSKLVSEFRAVSPHQMSEDAENINVEEVISQARNLASATVKPRATISTTINVRRNVLGSASRLAQVIINLLVNAAQAFPKDTRGNIAIRAYETEDSIKIEVRDNGSGISPEVLQDVFKPFFTTKPAGEGTGLGLSICRNIIEGMNGSLRLDSTVGKGTTAVIELPATDAVKTIQPPLADESSVASDRVPSVLVVDDETQIGRMFERVLRNRAEIVICNDVVTALQAARQQTYDIVVTDYVMPKMNGAEFVASLVEVDPLYRDRAIIMSGGRVEQPFDPPIPILTKPFGMKEIRAIITDMANSLDENA